MKKYDKFTTRGIIFITISVIGLGYEIVFKNQIELLVVFALLFVIGIGLICIFQLKETEE